MLMSTPNIITSEQKKFYLEHPEEIPILNLIPQRSPIVMVDYFCGLQDKTSKSSFTVRADNIFVRNGFLSEMGLIEHIAQSAGARIGYLCILENQEVPIGFIGSVNDVQIHRLPEIGDQLQTTVTLLHKIGPIWLIQAETRANSSDSHEGTLQMSCRMKIYCALNEI